MNINTPLKTLPLLAVLAVGLVLSPTVSMADKADRGQHKVTYSHNGGQSHSKGNNKGHYRSNKHSYKTHGKSHKNNHRSGHHYTKGHGNQHKHAHYKRGHHNHGYGQHNHSGHSNVKYVVNDHYYSDGLVGLDHLRFMIGLHTDNLDITFRD